MEYRYYKEKGRSSHILSLFSISKCVGYASSRSSLLLSSHYRHPPSSVVGCGRRSSVAGRSSTKCMFGLVHNHRNYCHRLRGHFFSWPSLYSSLSSLFFLFTIVVDISMGKKLVPYAKFRECSHMKEDVSKRYQWFGALDRNFLRLTAHRVSWPEEDSYNGMVTLLVNSVAIWTR